MKRGRPSTGGYSRNADYYVKKIRLSDAQGCAKISEYFSLNSQGSTVKEISIGNSSKKDDSDANVHVVNENSSPRAKLENRSSPSTDANFRKEKSPLKENNFKDHEISAVACDESEDFFEKNEISPLKSNCTKIEKSSAQTLKKEESSHKKQQNPLNIQKYEKLNNWIYYSFSGEGFLCKWCSISFTKGPWIDQAVCLGDHPSRCITRHEESSRHNQAVAASKISKPVSESIEEGAQAATQKEREANQILMTKYIKILYFMIKKQWAVSENFSSLVNFIGQDLGDKDIELYLNSCGKNATYLSTISVQNLTEAISIFLEEKTITSLQLSENFALLADESTDEAQREQLGLVARYKIPGLAEIKEDYLGIINLTTANAESITSAIKGFLLAKNIKMTNCLFLALDGANVMSGEISGVQRRMRHLSPHSLYINCRNHRLALVFAHLLKKYNLLQAVDALLVSLWKLFHYSPAKNQVFTDIQKDVYSADILKILKVSVTRWLSHGLACKRIVDRYQPLVEALDTIFYKTKEPEIKGIREALLDPENLFCLLFLADFLKIVNKLNLWLQSPNIMFGDICNKVLVTLHDVNEYTTNLDAGENFQKSSVLLEFAKEHTELSLKTRKNKKKQKLNSNEAIEDFKTSFVKPFINDFKEEMQNAFKTDSDVLGAFDLFSSLDLNLASKNDSDKTCLSVLLSFYGHEQRNEFQNTFNTSPPVIDAKAALKEIPEFEKEISLAKITFDLEKATEAKSLLKQDKKDQAKQVIEKKISPIEAMKIISRDASSTFPNLMKLLALSTIIPSSTASVERLFSRMNLVCTDLRTRLKQTTLDRHLRIILNGPQKLSDKECGEIINIFKQSGNRRIKL